MSGIDWAKLGISVPEIVMTVIGDHYGLYGRVLTNGTDLISDLGSDQIDMMEVIMTLEELFGLRFDPADSSSAKTVGDMVSLVETGLLLQENSSESPEPP